MEAARADGPMSQSSPGLWPCETPRQTKSEAERRVYNALKTSLPEGWYAWHSLKLRTKMKGEFSEADFIIADPNRPSILVLEVKGGQMEQLDGRWYQNSISLKTGQLWVFADEDQAFWEDRKIPESIERESFRVRLRKPYRCSPAIQNLTDCYAGRCQVDLQLLKSGIKDDIIRLVTCSEQRVTKQVGKEINRLLGDGLQSSEIAVISVRGRSEKENICHNEELGGHKVVPATDNDADSQIICDTFLRFKGLERPAVIVTDLRLVSDLYETRMYIAVSRATSLLRIVGVEKEMRKCHRLAELI